MSDQELHDLYSRHTLPDGKTYYEVIFPCDIASGKKIVITEEELYSGEAFYKNDNEITAASVSYLTTGDMDVTLLQMAFLRRFGDKVYKGGSWIHDMKNMLRRPDDVPYDDVKGFSPDDFRNLAPNMTVSVIYRDEWARMGIKFPYTLPDGRTIDCTFFSKSSTSGGWLKLSDGSFIYLRHAYAVSGYDASTDEILLRGNEDARVSILRIPVAMAFLLEGARQKQ